MFSCEFSKHFSEYFLIGHLETAASTKWVNYLILPQWRAWENLQICWQRSFSIFDELLTNERFLYCLTSDFLLFEKLWNLIHFFQNKKMVYLTHFQTMLLKSLENLPWKYQKTYGFLMFLGSIEVKHCLKIVQFYLKPCTHHSYQFKSSHPEVFNKKGVLKNFTKFTGKLLSQSLFLKLQVFHSLF